MKELEEEWAKLDTTPPKPTRLTRSQQEKQAQAPPVEAAAAAAESVEEGNSSFIASFNLKNISKGFYSLFMSRLTVEIFIGASLSEPHCYVANRGKRNALWCVRTRNFSTVIKIPSACDRNFYQFVVNLPIVFPSSQLLRQFAWLRISQDASHFARRNLLAELVEQ